MHIRELKVKDAYVITPQEITDERGTFLESFRADLLEKVIGHRFVMKQANTSVSRRGVVRGIHFADVPPGQAKYVTALAGAVMDFVVDMRVGSPTFGTWDSVRLDAVGRRAVYLSEGLGHAFVALTEGATVNYSVSGLYSPTSEHAVHPLDAELGLDFSESAAPLQMSKKDAEAPTLHRARELGILPTWERCEAFYRSLKNAGG